MSLVGRTHQKVVQGKFSHVATHLFFYAVLFFGIVVVVVVVLNLFLFFFSGVVAGVVVTTFGMCFTTVAGSLLMTVGMVSSAFVSNPYLLYVTYGLTAGTGLL